MLDPNTFMLARAIHEQRIEAINKQQFHGMPNRRGGYLVQRMLNQLGDHFIAFGTRLRASTNAPSQPQQVVQ